jgi:hypothetical protein
MKNILNVIADILTLLAVCIAAIGHVLPWFDQNRVARLGVDMGPWLGDFQTQYSQRSGAALAVLGVLLCLSLLFNWGHTMRRLLNLGMFASAFIALLFELMIFSNYFNRDGQNPVRFHDTDVGFHLAMIATCVALFFSLVRMLWTMPPVRPVRPADLDRKPALELPPKEPGFTERRG